jgi:histidine triad (HIT) family protein
MTEKCVFCKIIRKEQPAHIIYEDNEVMAFLSHRPVNEGHTLVVPKKHYRDLYDISEDEAAYLFRITKRLMHAVKDAVNAQGVRIVQNNGEAAGQVVFHLHAHIIPLKPRDDIHNSGVYKNHISQRSNEELKQDAEKIKSQICDFVN